MWIKRSLYLIAFAALSFSACTKETSWEPGDNNGTGNVNGNASQQIEGLYDFVGLSAHTEVITDMTGLGMSIHNISVSDYASTTQTGTAEFKAGTLKWTNFGYDVEGIIKSTTDGDYDEAPFNFTISDVNSSGPYTLIGTDSLYTPSGVTEFPDGSGGSTPVQSNASGSRYTWSGDTLIITTQVRSSETGSEQGISFSIQNYIKGITKLKKRK